MLNSSTIKDLLRKHLSDTLTGQEQEELDKQLSGNEQADEWASAINELFTEKIYARGSYSPDKINEILNQILTDHSALTPVISLPKQNKSWWKYAAAILVCVGIGAYLWMKNNQHPSALATTVQSTQISEITPGYSKATLTLSNGKTVNLNKGVKEKINDGEISIENANGELIYRNNTINAMNTMTTPKGGQYQLTLSDGTKVWLNAASSITYPTAFTTNTREVSITGEVYFEVNKNPSKPFIVNTIKEKITVLGTAFNVNVYRDEPESKTSLIDGSIKIGQQLLQPGEAYMNGKVIQTNTAQDIAWKNGGFDFENIDIKTAMRQVSRWYDVNVIYEGNIPDVEIGGKIGRDLTLSQVLRSLSGIGVKTKLNGNTVIVLSQDK
jgi:transmembrane sensor